jgi:diguanylate cyclase (GGDEF)-like protein
MPILVVGYSSNLVVVSVLLSICSSFVALSLSDGMRAAATVGVRRFWLTSGSIAMGVGIWSMHFLGMLALKLPVAVFYYWPIVLLSMLLAAAASSVVLSVVSGELLTTRRLFGGGLLLGAGIAAMHYTGMAAMRSSAMEQYNPWFVTLSIIAAAALSWLALWIAFAAGKTTKYRIRLRLVGSVVMGIGIAAMHYIAMVGVRFGWSSMPVATAHTVKVDTLGEFVIAAASIVILLVALGTATIDKWRLRDLGQAHADLLQAQEALLKSQQELRELNGMLSELSVRDGLTGLYNRRHFDSVLAIEWNRAARSQKPISLLMIDVDCFKLLNDGYGHQRGDDCLREVARVLEEHPHRGYDVMARYGGEEFVLLLPDANADAAQTAAESIRSAVHALGIENRHSPVADVVTVSIGVSCENPHAGNDARDFVRKADTALYAAKRLGKNQIAMAREWKTRV